MNVTSAPSLSTSSASLFSEDADKVRLPTVILWDCVVPFIADRKTWNALVTVNKEMYQQSQATTAGPDQAVMIPPWPQVRWKLLDGIPVSVAFGPGLLACGTDRGNIQVWNNRNGKTWVLGNDDHRPNSLMNRFTMAQFTMVFHNLLLSCWRNGTVLIWKNQDWTKCYSFLVKTKSGGRQVDSSCAWLDEPGVVRFAAACKDRTIYIFRIVFDHKATAEIDFIKDQEIQTLHTGQIRFIGKFGHYIVSEGSHDGLLAWDILLDSNRQEGDVAQPYPMTLSSGGGIRSMHVFKNVLAVACGKNIVLYDDSLQEINVIKGYHGIIRCVTFAFDGTSVASAYDDGTICVWNVHDGICIEKCQGHGGSSVCALDFQGTNLVSVGSNGTVAIWDMSRVKSW